MMDIERMLGWKDGRPKRRYRSKSRTFGRTGGGNTVAVYIRHQSRHNLSAAMVRSCASMSLGLKRSSERKVLFNH